MLANENLVGRDDGEEFGRRMESAGKIANPQGQRAGRRELTRLESVGVEPVRSEKGEDSFRPCLRLANQGHSVALFEPCGETSGGWCELAGARAE